ncbi:MAG: dihydroneopterin aldolase family protein [Promethearchaeota archaeon]
MGNNKKNNIVAGLFSSDLSDRERASFELGIKLGALFHIAIGIPISKDKEVINAVEKALQKSISCQPYVTSAKVKLLVNQIKGEKVHQFDYSSINPECLSAEIKVKFKNVNIEGKVEWNEELSYPLMYINKISEN